MLFSDGMARMTVCACALLISLLDKDINQCVSPLKDVNGLGVCEVLM